MSTEAATTLENGLPPGWATVTLADVLPSPRPKIQPSPDTDLPFVGMDSIAPGSTSVGEVYRFSEMKSAAGHFLPGDVLYGRMRPYLNKVYRADFEGACSAEFIVIPESTYLDSDFLKFLLHNQDFVAFASGKSSGDRPRVDISDISGYVFGLPPLNDQRRIVEKIDELFSQIEAGEQALERAQTLLDRYRQSVLNAAVTGELTRDWREQHKSELESGEDLLARIFQARRDAWEQAELAKMHARGKPPTDDRWKQKYKEPALPDAAALPALPEGWVWATIGALAEIVGGITVDAKRKGPSLKEVPYLRVANVQRGRLDLSEVKTILAPLDKIKALRLQYGDILLNEGGDRDKIGRGWIWEDQIANCIHQNHVFRARSLSQIVPPKFVSYYANEFGREYFFAEGKQTTNLASINLIKVSLLPVPVPPPAEALLILELIDEMVSIVDHMQNVQRG